MRAPRNRYREDYVREHADFIARVLAEVRAVGPITSGALAKRLESKAPRVGWWGWSEAKRAVELLFSTGEVAVKDRVNFQRRYDLPERVHPPEVLEGGTPTDEARLELLALGAAALGIGTIHDLADYYRLPLTAARALLPLLLERGDVREVSVEGWRNMGYLHRDAAAPRRVSARALLGPFDSLVWAGAATSKGGYRDRLKRLFDFEYRIGIYDRAAERTGGYYVLPFLLGERLVARVDLKADRQADALLVRHAALEDHAGANEVAVGLDAELAAIAEWLGLGGVRVEADGPLAATLRAGGPT
jgi:uncharacterized protein YcaQ